VRGDARHRGRRARPRGLGRPAGRSGSCRRRTGRCNRRPLARSRGRPTEPRIRGPSSRLRRTRSRRSGPPSPASTLREQARTRHASPRDSTTQDQTLTGVRFSGYCRGSACRSLLRDRQARIVGSTSGTVDRPRPCARPSAVKGHGSRRARRSSTPVAQKGSTRRPSAISRTRDAVNVCRVCVVEVTGSRVLVPPARASRAGGVQTDSERVRLSRKMSSNFSLVGRTSRPRQRPAGYMTGTAPTRPLRPAGRPKPTRASATPTMPGIIHARRVGSQTVRPARQGRQRPLRPRLLRSASSATSASRLRGGPQNTFAMPSRGAGRRRISTEEAFPSPTRVRSTAAIASASARPGAECSSPSSTCGPRDVGRERPDGDRHDLPVLRRSAARSVSRPGQHIVTVGSPLDSSVTEGISASRAASASSSSRTADLARALKR